MPKKNSVKIKKILNKEYGSLFENILKIAINWMITLLIQTLKENKLNNCALITDKLKQNKQTNKIINLFIFFFFYDFYNFSGIASNYKIIRE